MKPKQFLDNFDLSTGVQMDDWIISESDILRLMQSFAERYHQKEMERKLEEATEEMSGAFKNTSTHVFYEDGWIDGVNWVLNHLKEEKP